MMHAKRGIPMKLVPTAIPEVLLLEPKVYGDERGFFFESFNARRFAELTGVHTEFVQDNHSKSAHKVLRGLHYQLGAPQGKLVRVSVGAVFDVVLDLRRSAPSFGRWVGVELSAENRRQIWVPPGFAHGFVALSDGAECLYKMSEYWSPERERAIRWDDPALAIAWPFEGAPRLSDKDREASLLADAEVFA
jgi:dTDP-4-dehydrorhamnose 3,5-epimerase